MVINSFKKMLKINKQLPLGICLAFYALVSQGAYPDKSIRLVVPFATGGTSEIIARSVANALTTQMGHVPFA
jgi:tripartite-type tricarboxylate transporter receptor subunit TctC